jgi:hypothetical protein
MLAEGPPLQTQWPASSLLAQLVAAPLLAATWPETALQAVPQTTLRTLCQQWRQLARAASL